MRISIYIHIHVYIHVHACVDASSRSCVTVKKQNKAVSKVYGRNRVHAHTYKQRSRMLGGLAMSACTNWPYAFVF